MVRFMVRGRIGKFLKAHDMLVQPLLIGFSFLERVLNFLISDDARFIAGADLSVDAGFTAA